MIWTSWEDCTFCISGQCMLQCGDNEDITEEEMRPECVRYYNICPASVFSPRHKRVKGGDKDDK